MSAAFARGSEYFGAPVWCWNLPSGYTCPGAKDCLTYADPKTGRQRHGAHQKFKCYSAVTERYPAVRKAVWANRLALRGKNLLQMANVILAAMPPTARFVRIHAGGDFFSQEYFDAWLMVCAVKPDVKFWAFTKSVDFWTARFTRIPRNLTLQASLGGHHDGLIDQHHLKFARVVWSKQEAARLGLRVDTDDTMAMSGDESFALIENFTKRKPDHLRYRNMMLHLENPGARP